MKIIVMKFGGTSVSNVKKIRNVAEKVSDKCKKNKIVVVLSAMSGVTDQLQSYIDEIDYPPSKETDLIMTSGEQVTIGLLSMLLNKQGIKSLPLLGWQIPIITDESYEKGKILNIHPSLLPKYKGLNTHTKAINNKDKFAGCTVHYVTENLDSGKIILQKKIRIAAKDNPSSLAKKVLKQEHKLYPAAIIKVFS